MSKEKPGFTVKDRRIFAEENEDAKNVEEKKESPKQEAKEEESQVPFPEINFATFIISLNASALVHLGVIDDPTTGKKVKSLPMGKQTIDILGLLEEKTKGNLPKEEENLLKNILYDLRIIYVKEQG
ncbi:MAG: DUF1844 domain-containing protein [Proteobacteria bacterium]|nr:DUF1844 domain-containing protein [Desulfobacteraceae bacterium]MBU2521020.1 DUF1844 domain-containing protein [Pseudomonadota bacterium]MBU3981584.1 DUF1844 domain-containing protein [Pseudomonadota bacterium]MBU4013784.1 DUF1844 domain-containing protein [Pseudomonadota bacterium]MBU4067725.1 DUF1844 domain-containing protein [Pseudomonadota bacterium]